MATSEIRRLRQRLHLLLTEPETATLDDEAWWSEFTALLDPVYAARAQQKRAERAALWASWTSANPPAVFETTGDDPDND